MMNTPHRYMLSGSVFVLLLLCLPLRICSAQILKQNQTISDSDKIEDIFRGTWGGDFRLIKYVEGKRKVWGAHIFFTLDKNSTVTVQGFFPDGNKWKYDKTIPPKFSISDRQFHIYREKGKSKTTIQRGTLSFVSKDELEYQLTFIQDSMFDIWTPIVLRRVPDGAELKDFTLKHTQYLSKPRIIPLHFWEGCRSYNKRIPEAASLSDLNESEKIASKHLGETIAKGGGGSATFTLMKRDGDFTLDLSLEAYSNWLIYPCRTTGIGILLSESGEIVSGVETGKQAGGSNGHRIKKSSKRYKPVSAAEFQKSKYFAVLLNIVVARAGGPMGGGKTVGSNTLYSRERSIVALVETDFQKLSEIEVGKWKEIGPWAVYRIRK